MTWGDFQGHITITQVEGQEEPCWVWSGPSTVHINKHSYSPERAACLFGNQEVPKGLVLWRKCATANCCRPEHHEPLTRSEWATRSLGRNPFHRQASGE